MFDAGFTHKPKLLRYRVIGSELGVQIRQLGSERGRSIVEIDENKTAELLDSYRTKFNLGTVDTITLGGSRGALKCAGQVVAPCMVGAHEPVLAATESFY